MPGFESGDLGPENTPSREEFLDFATELAGRLDGQGSIKRVGLIGSVVKGKEYPDDLDMVVFVSQPAYETFIDAQLEMIETARKRIDLRPHVTDLLAGANKPDEDDFIFGKILGLDLNTSRGISRFLVTNYPLNRVRSQEKGQFALPHFILLPDRIDSDLAKKAIVAQWNPTFISGNEKDYHEFDRGQLSFVPRQIYSEEEMHLVRGQEFSRLKEVSANPDHPLYQQIEAAKLRNKSK